MPPCGKISPVNTVTAHHIQIGANHHTDVHTDINETHHGNKFLKNCLLGNATYKLLTWLS